MSVPRNSINSCMRAYEFYNLNEVNEFTADKIIADLQSLGYENLKKQTGRVVKVLVPNKDRSQVLKTLLDKLPGATHNPNVGGSLGSIVYGGGQIQVKPQGGQGDESAGIKNEQHLVQTINRYVEERGPLSITFVGDNGKKITAYNVTSAVGAGKKTANRRKSDVNLISGSRVIPISIKKRNAEYWESADTLFGGRADTIIDELVEQGKVKLTPIDAVRPDDGVQKVRIRPEVAIKATMDETADIVFGSDILEGEGAVVKQTFNDEHYTIHDNNLSITCDLVIDEPEDIPPELQVYFLIRNDMTRNRPGSKYPGLRVLGSYASRVKRALIVDPTTL